MANAYCHSGWGGGGGGAQNIIFTNMYKNKGGEKKCK